VVEAKRKPPEQIRKELHPEAVRESQRDSLIWHPVGVRSFLPASTGGLRFAAITGYFLATLRVASLHSALNSRNQLLQTRLDRGIALAPIKGEHNNCPVSVRTGSNPVALRI